MPTLSNARAAQRLKELPTVHGFAIEPPRRNTLVAATVALSRWRGYHLDTPLVDPSKMEIDHEEKVLFAYVQGDEFFRKWFGGQAALSDLAGRDVLDVGCGWGGKAIYYAEHSGLRSMTAFDMDWEMDAARSWAQGRGVKNCTFLNATAEQMPFEDGSFDVVVTEDVLEHVEDPERVLSECARVLRPGGRLLARFPSIQMMWAHHFDRITVLPGLHRILPMKTWAAGFNYEIAARELDVLPFSRIEARFGRDVCCDLSGMDFTDFERIVLKLPFTIERLEMERFEGPQSSVISRRLRYPMYARLQRVPWLREFLSLSITFIGVRAAADAPRLRLG